MDRERGRVLRATAFGNVVEWYDFGLYAAFANAIAATFFVGDVQTRTLSVFAAFGVAFLVRPLGALLFGHLGDKYGRRNTLAAALFLTSVATGGIGLLPGHEVIGWAAPVLLVTLRIVQGMAIGGAFGGSTAFIVEHAPPARRGAHGGVQWSTMALGLAAGVATGALFNQVLSPASVEQWGWRTAFLAAFPLGLISLYIRLRTDETPMFEALRSTEAPPVSPLGETLLVARRELLVGLGLVAAISCAVNFFFVFLPNHLANAGRATPQEALSLCVGGLLLLAAVSPAAGALSDRLGRRPVTITGILSLLVTVGPACLAVEDGNTAALVAAYLCIGAGLGAVAPSTFLSELFPTRLRYSGLSLTYGVGSALTGGATPLLAAAIVGPRGSVWPMAALMAALLAGAAACVAMARESSPRRVASHAVVTHSGPV